MSSRQPPDDVPLVLGGHSFIRQLGNEPRPDAGEQARIVAVCLDAGIRWFDTMYAPERVALGRAALVDRNAASWRRGPLTAPERERLARLVEARRGA